MRKKCPKSPEASRLGVKLGELERVLSCRLSLPCAVIAGRWSGWETGWRARAVQSPVCMVLVCGRKRKAKEGARDAQPGMTSSAVLSSGQHTFSYLLSQAIRMG